MLRYPAWPRPLPDTEWKWPLIVAISVIAGLVMWGLIHVFGLFGFVFALPLAAFPVAMLVLEGGAAGIRWLQWAPYAEWQGLYYNFEGYHLRGYDVEGELWFVDRDVLAVLGLRKRSALVGLFSTRERARIADTPWFGLSQAGIERLLMKSPHPLAKRFLVWFQREVFAPHAKRKELDRLALYGGRPPPVVDILPTPPALQERPKP
jgi:hypothetical protein